MMALDGYFYGSTNNQHVKPKITWQATQNADENYSDITVRLSYSRTNTGYTTDGTWSGQIRIGEQVFTGEKELAVTYESDTEAMTATARVFHDPYGQLSLSISATGAIATSSVSQTTIGSQVQLPPIPRISTVSAASACIGSPATIVVARKNERFSHSLAYQFGVLEGYIDREGNITDTEQKMVETVVNFALPESFYQQMTDRSEQVCRIVCRTYRSGVYLGQRSCNLMVFADPSLCAPEITAFSVTDLNAKTVALTGDTGALVRYASLVSCRVAARGKWGAQIVSMQVNGVEAENGEAVFPCADGGNYTLTVTDSRGFQKTASRQLPLIPYRVLSCRADAQRTDPTADSALITLSGSCWKGNFGAAENELTVTCSVAGQAHTLTPQILDNHTYATQLTVFGVSYTQNYPVELTVSDGIQTVTRQLTIRKATPVFDWGEHEFRFHVPVVLDELFIGGQTLEEYIRAVAQGGTT